MLFEKTNYDFTALLMSFMYRSLAEFRHGGQTKSQNCSTKTSYFALMVIFFSGNNRFMFISLLVILSTSAYLLLLAILFGLEQTLGSAGSSGR